MNEIPPIGAKLQVLKGDEWREGEILSSRTTDTTTEVYIHYTNFNKRLDEWVPLSRLDTTTITIPKADTPAPSKSSKKKKSAAANDLMQLTEGLHNAKADELEQLRRGGSMTQSPEEVHRVKNISAIVFGTHQIETWYFSPYPKEYAITDLVYICEFCLSHYNDQSRFERHRLKCQLFHPPGNEIYRSGSHSFFEVDGHKQRTWCRNLCLLSKLFLDHKALYYDVNPFLFYVLTQNDELGCHVVGYFSKEKESLDGYNVACILTLPSHQRKGYGRLLIQFSYLLSSVEGKLGSPEKPLSDLGLLGYRSYWSEVLLSHLFQFDAEISVQQLSAVLNMTPDDVLHTLQHLDLLRYYNGQYIIALNETHREQYEKFRGRKGDSIDGNYLDWKPPVFSATQLRYI